MNRRWKEVMSILSAFACLLCMAMSFLCTEGDDRENVRTLQLKEAYQAQEAYQVQETIFWGETQDVNVSARELNRNTSAVQVTVCGDTQIIFSSTRGLDEELTCLISPSLAFKLFGNADGTGQNIQLQDAEYQVRGMLDCENPVIVVPASFNPDSILDKVSVKLPDGMGTEQGISNFTAQTGIQGDILSYHLYHQWTKFMAYAVPCLLYLFVCIQMLRTIRKSVFTPAVRATVLFTAAVTGIVSGIWILNLQIEIPRELLPTKWSDFEFWSDLWERMSQDISLLMKAGKSEIILQDYHNFLKTVGYSITALVLGCFTFTHLLIKNSIILWTASAAAMILTYLFFTANIQSSVSLTHNRILWLLMPACFIMNFISGRHFEKINPSRKCVER